jgi:flagellar FliL protein
MADEDDNNEPAEVETKSGKSKLLLFVAIALLLTGGSVGGTLFFLGFFDPPEATVEELAEQESSEAKEQPAMYFPIKPPFVVNFQSRGRQRFLQTDVTVMTRDAEVFSAIQKHLPSVKNRLVMILGGGVYQELQTNEGRELMRQQAHRGVQAVITEEIGKDDGVEQILFTNFVMQ